MITIIFPVYNEQDNLKELYKRVCDVSSQVRGHECEFLFVDDCSTDATPRILKELHEQDKRVKTVRFARNCGSHAALSAGLSEAKGDCAIVLAADLQDPPEIIPELISEWEKGFKTVWGVRVKREGESAATRFSSRLYYALMNKLTSVKVPPAGADVFLADRVVINALKQIPEKHTSIFMALAWLGFRQTGIGYVKQARFKGASKWTLRKKIKLTVDSLLSFSDIPIRYMSMLGFLTALLGFVYAFKVFLNYTDGSPVQGWSSLMVVLLVIGGVQMIMLGLLGEYLWRTFDESRRRPRFIIEYKID